MARRGSSDGPVNSTCRVYESMGEYLSDWHETRNALSSNDRSRLKTSWDGNLRECGDVDRETAMARAVTGDDSLVSSALAMLAKVNVPMGLTTGRVTVSDVVGSRVSVGAYLSGSPRCMRRRVKGEVERRHVNVYVSCGVSASISGRDMLRRGTAVLALLEGLQSAGVACDVYVTFDCTYDGGPSAHDYRAIKLDTPLCLATAGFALAHPAWSRLVMFDRAEVGFGQYSGLYRPDVNRVRAAYGMAPEDIYVPWVYSGSEPELANPVEWAQSHLHQLAAPTEVV